jgi:hypothetical protein
MVAVIGIVTGAQPQSKVMAPPFATAALSDAKLQLAGVPLPMTTGLEIVAGWPPAGTPALHDPLGLPAGGVVPHPPSFVALVPPSAGVVLDEAPREPADDDALPVPLPRPELAFVAPVLPAEPPLPDDEPRVALLEA